MRHSDLQVISSGTPMIPVSTALLTDWFSRVATTQVQVPAAVTTSLFVFSFENEVNIRQDFKRMSSQRIASTLQLLKAAMASVVDEQEVIRMASELELIPSDSSDGAEASNVVSMIQSAIRRAFLQQGVSTFFIEDVLSRTGMEVELSDIRGLKYADVHAAIGQIQYLYSRIASSAPSTEITTQIRDLIQNSKLFSIARRISFIMTNSPGGSVSTRLSHVINTFAQGMYDSDIVSMKEELPGLVYKVTDTNGFPNLSYKELMGGYFAMIRTVMGVSTTNSAETINFSDLLQGLMTGVEMPLPFLPSDLRPDTLQRVEEFVVKQFTSRLIELIITRQYGTVASSLRSIMDDRKYKRNDAFDTFLQEGIDVVSVIFEAFRSVAGSIRGLIDNPNIYFDDVHPLRRKFFTQQLWDYLSQFSSFSTAADDRRRLYDLALIVNEGSYMQTGIPKWLAPDSVLQQASDSTFYSNAEGTEYTSYIRQESSSSVWDAPVSLQPFVWAKAPVVGLKYFVAQSTPDFLIKYDAMRAAFMLHKMSSVYKKSSFSQFLAERAVIQYIGSLDEFALKLNLPLQYAQRLYSGPDFYMDFSSSTEHMIIWDFDIAPVFEVKLVSDTNYHVQPWLGRYPFMLRRVAALVELDRNEPIDPARELGGASRADERSKKNSAKGRGKGKANSEDDQEGGEGADDGATKTGGVDTGAKTSIETDTGKSAYKGKGPKVEKPDTDSGKPGSKKNRNNTKQKGGEDEQA